MFLSCVLENTVNVCNLWLLMEHFFWRWDFAPSAGDGIMDVHHHYGVLI